MSTFKLIVSTPDGHIFDDDVKCLSLRGTEGDLAVMAGHIPFATVVKPGSCKIETEAETKEAEVDGGILTVGEDKTILLSGSFKWKE
ncbi:MAG: hypothetical protein IKT14_01130 [Clostridiales bacterium]|nr:hypothetical protein [Clostridiales bacterium]